VDRDARIDATFEARADRRRRAMRALLEQCTLGHSDLLEALEQKLGRDCPGMLTLMPVAWSMRISLMTE
jgi:hypothetical protein